MSVATHKLSDGRTVKLGRKAPRPGRAVLRFASYFDPSKVPVPPASVDYSAKAMPALQRMYLNDTYGDCVIAGKGHALGVWTGNEDGTPIQATDQEIYATYQSWCGPGDNGCVITDVLDRMKSQGFTASGQAYKIDGYVAIDWTNKVEVQIALLIFGALTLGINLPAAWDGSGPVWDVTNSRIVGGHDVTAVGYDAQGVQISSWGKIYTITWAAFLSRNWLEECYAILSPNWYDKANVSPSGFDSSTLAADLAKLAGGVIPDITPTPVVPPSPPSPPSPPAPVPQNLVFVGDPVTIPPFGLKNYRPTGTIIQGAAKPMAFSIDWIGLETAGLSLSRAYLLQDADGFLAAFDAILAALGIPTPVSHRLRATAINWGSIFLDVASLVAAISIKDPTAIMAAVMKLVADLGITL